MTNSAAEVVKEVKGLTSHELRQKYPALKRLPSLWTRSYFASTAGNVSEETIRRYIDAQKGVWPMKTFCYRLYPSKAQARLLEETRETCRRFYNDCLAERRDGYEKDKRTVGKFEQLRRVKERKAANLYAAKVHSHILQVVVTDLDRAFQAFFRRVKAGETPGYPRFKGRHRFDSFGLKEYGNGFKIDGRRLKVSGIGRIVVRWHRPIEGTVNTVRIVRKADGWYACFACEVEPKPLPSTGAAIGIDVGVASLITTSEGEKTPHPGWYREGQRKLRVLQRRVARKKKGGHRRRKAVAALKRHHQHVSNRRKDFLNNLAHDLVQSYDIIGLEEIRISNLVRNRHLATSILDAGWGYLVAHLTHKAVEAGREVILVNPAYTSKTCSGCGAIFENLTLSDRHVTCSCGVSLDRDHNAAINILKAALILLDRAGRARRGITWPVAASVLREAASL
jgi:putative transposase